MGVSERREKEKIIRKNDIVQAAIKLFFEKGVENTTMDDIAKKAEYTKRTIYFYFNSKESILAAFLSKGYEIINNLVERYIFEVKDKNSIEKMFAVGRAYIYFYKEHREFLNMINNYRTKEPDITLGDENIKELYFLADKQSFYLSEIITSGIKEGSFRKDLNPEEAVLLIWSCFVGISNLLLNKSDYLKMYKENTPENLLNMMNNLIYNYLTSSDYKIINNL
ncbi:MAG: hypothetical protein A2086_08910 [Spirochaetes bacterium GWD1_27_9]|nr:MAG: hypothetical protein A2086_08910 [Spirochaetes bacterium GWD1_27_9]